MLKKIFKKKDDSQDIATLIQDAKACLANGYFDDAVSVIDSALLQENKSPSNYFDLYNTLISIYEQQGNQDLANATRHKLLNYIKESAPERQDIALPIMLALYKAKQFTADKDEVNALAKLAFQQQDHETAIQIVGQFSKNHPQHPDIVANYLIVGKALTAKGEAEKAYRLLGGLLKSYPNDWQATEVKTAFLAAKDIMQGKGKTNYSQTNK